VSQNVHEISRRELFAATAVVGLDTIAARPAQADAVNDSGGDLAERRREAEQLRTQLARVQFPPTALPRIGGPAFWPCSTGGRPNTDDSLQLVAARVGHIDRSRLSER